MGLPLELDGAPFSAEGLKSTKRVSLKIQQHLSR